MGVGSVSGRGKREWEGEFEFGGEGGYEAKPFLSVEGLGTSSILGGAILGALWRAAGQQHSHDSLIHAVGCFML